MRNSVEFVSKNETFTVVNYKNQYIYKRERAISKKTLAQKTEYHIYRQIPLHMINSKNKFETLVWRLKKGLAQN